MLWAEDRRKSADNDKKPGAFNRKRKLQTQKSASTKEVDELAETPVYRKQSLDPKILRRQSTDSEAISSAINELQENPNSVTVCTPTTIIACPLATSTPLSSLQSKTPQEQQTDDKAAQKTIAGVFNRFELALKDSCLS